MFKSKLALALFLSLSILWGKCVIYKDILAPIFSKVLTTLVVFASYMHIIPVPVRLCVHIIGTKSL